MAGQEIAWIVHTHEHQERSTDWFWGLGLLALAGAAVSVFLGNILLALIIALGAGSIGALALRGPRTHWVKIDVRGVTLDGTLYPYESLHSFWAEERAEPRLLITTNAFLSPQIVIPLLENSRAGAVRLLLKRHMQEEEQVPHLGEEVARLFGL